MADDSEKAPNELNPLAAKRVSYSERFEKTRLAILSYSAVALLLSVAAHGNEAASGLFPGAPTLNVNALVLLSLTAACAYVVVFLLSEIPTSSKLNTEMLHGVTWETLKARVARVERTLTALDEETEQTVSFGLAGLPSTRRDLSSLLLTEHLDALFKAVEYPEEIVGPRYLHDEIRALPRKRFDETIALFTRAAHEFDGRSEALNLLPSRIEQIKQATEKLRPLIETMKTQNQAELDRLTAYSSAIDPIEAMRFRLWDCAVPVTFYFMAAAAAMARALHYLPWSSS